MKTFSSIDGMLAHFSVMEAGVLTAIHHGLKKCAESIEATAKGEIGHYQSETPPFAGWAELADSTKADRLQKGYSENDPLLRSGELRDSISHEVHELEAVVGSTSDIMVDQELGTKKIPPRAVLGPAAVNNVKMITHTLTHEVTKALVHGSGVTPGLLL